MYQAWTDCGIGHFEQRLLVCLSDDFSHLVLYCSCLGLPMRNPGYQDIQRVDQGLRSKGSSRRMQCIKIITFASLCCISAALTSSEKVIPQARPVDYRIPTPPSLYYDPSLPCRDQYPTLPSESPHLHPALSSAQPHFPATLPYYTDQ